MLASNKTLTEHSVTYLILKGEIIKPVTSVHHSGRGSEINATQAPTFKSGVEKTLSCLI